MGKQSSDSRKLPPPPYACRIEKQAMRELKETRKRKAETTPNREGKNANTKCKTYTAPLDRSFSKGHEKHL
ncbi:hypothetical protein CEXT_145121 [Caerostris extrusa]|uniref:Uncharacterized protein n=1 Tax=Caerostris extrusa TaxID=172846 RepID=A0AAV4PVW8_CAEEX|nr:hypothetical protein CEXT_145121 [Caerostris extrusa]